MAASSALPWLALLVNPTASPERRGGSHHSNHRSPSATTNDDAFDGTLARADAAFAFREVARLQESIADRNDTIAYLEASAAERDKEWLQATRSAVAAARDEGERAGFTRAHSATQAAHVEADEARTRAALVIAALAETSGAMQRWCAGAVGIETVVSQRREKAGEFDRVALRRENETLQQRLEAAVAARNDCDSELAAARESASVAAAERQIMDITDCAEPLARATLEWEWQAEATNFATSMASGFAKTAADERAAAEALSARCQEAVQAATEEAAAAAKAAETMRDASARSDGATAAAVAAMEAELNDLTAAFDEVRAQSDNDRAQMSATLLTALEAAASAVAEQHRAHVADVWNGASAALQLRAADVRAARWEAEADFLRSEVDRLAAVTHDLMWSLAEAQKSAELEACLLDAELGFEAECAGPRRLRAAVDSALDDAHAAHAAEQRRAAAELANVRHVANRTALSAEESFAREVVAASEARAAAGIVLQVCHAGARFGAEERLMLEQDVARLRDERDTLLDALESERTAREAAEVRAAEAAADVRELSAALDGARIESAHLAQVSRADDVAAVYAARAPSPTFYAPSSPHSNNPAIRAVSMDSEDASFL